MVTINEVISRIRGQVKAEVQDAFVTDRYIYSLITKYAKFLMRRQDFANKLMKFNSIWNFFTLRRTNRNRQSRSTMHWYKNRMHNKENKR